MESDSIVLQGDNYDVWSDSVEHLLTKEDLWSVVKSPEPSRQEDDEDWRTKNFKALQVICNSCGQKAFFKINGINLAREAWNILAENYAMLDSITAGNFVDWSAHLKSYLMARDLWSVVELRQEDNEVASKNWMDKNFEALKALRNFCGCEALYEINGVKSAQDAWNTLVEKYDGVNTDNYAHWKNRVKSYLADQSLWNIIESTSEPPEQEDDEGESMSWNEKNSKALEVIRSSCGRKTFSDIDKTSPAKIVWDHLAERFDIRDRIKKGRDLVKAVKNKDLGAVEEFLRQHPSLVGAKITCWGETALHIAVAEGEESIVKKLVEQMSPKDLETVDDKDYTALAQATIRGHNQMVDCMLGKNDNLTCLEAASRHIPVVLAIEYKHKHLARYLLPRTPLKVLKQEKGIHGTTVCTQAIYNGMLDIALELLDLLPHLALAVDLDNYSPLYVLASTYAFWKESRLGSWKRWICQCYCHCFVGSIIRSGEQSQSALHMDENSVNIGIDQIQTGGSDVYLEEKKSLVLAGKLLRLMSEQISISTAEDIDNGLVFSSVNLAIRKGMSDFLSEVLDKNGGLKWTVDHEGRTIFSNAILFRQGQIYKMMLDSPDKEVMIKSLDYGKNNILHIAGMLAPRTELDRIPGAVSQMQYELKWYKMVEKIVPATTKEAKNKDGLTPRALFTEAHSNLRTEGEKSVKETAKFGTVIDTLVITLVFAASITSPGGYNQDTGFPMLLNEKLFKLYMVCNTLSFAFSSFSMLMFLEIILTKYIKEEDFLVSLPMKMIMALSTLWISLAIMMTGLCCALGLVLPGQQAIVTPIIFLISIPLSLLVRGQLILIVDICVSTFGS